MATLEQQLNEKKQKLESYIGQLLDVKRGFLPELVITKDNAEAIDLIHECLRDCIDAIDSELRNKTEGEIEKRDENGEPMSPKDQADFYEE